MPPVTWDGTLAAFAQNWANNLASSCNGNLEHSSPNNYGENLAYSDMSTPETASRVVSDWMSESTMYDTSTNMCTGGDGDLSCAHFTQVLWKTTTTIGCATATCPDPSGGNTQYYSACEYNPAGNCNGLDYANPGC